MWQELLIIKTLLFATGLTTIVAATTALTGNDNDVINQSVNEDIDMATRDKRGLDLSLLVRTLLQNSALKSAPQPKPTSKPITPQPLPLYPPLPPLPIPVGPGIPRPPYLTPGYYGPKNIVYQPNNNLPFVKDQYGYVHFIVPTTQPPPPAPTTARPATSKLTQTQQQKQALINFLASLSGVSQAPATTTQPPPPLPPGVYIPRELWPAYQQQLRNNAVYKYVQQDDTSSDERANNIPDETYGNRAATPVKTALQPPKPPTPSSSSEYNYVDETNYKDAPTNGYYPEHTFYENQLDGNSNSFRITYPDDNDDYYQSETSERRPQTEQELQNNDEYVNN